MSEVKSWQRILREVYESADASYWLKNALSSAAYRDPVDALKDAEDLVHLLKRRIELEFPALLAQGNSEE